MRITVVNTPEDLVKGAENQDGILVWHEVRTDANGDVLRRFTHILSPNQHVSKDIAILLRTLQSRRPPGVSTLTREDLVPYDANYTFVSYLTLEEVMERLGATFTEMQ